MGSNVVTGIATFSTVISNIPTESQILIPAGDYWNQAGAVWNFTTGTQGVGFIQPGKTTDSVA